MMPKRDEMNIAQLLQNSDKAEFIEFVKEHIGDAVKCLVVFADANDTGGLDLKTRQIGFQYAYEIQGFVEWLTESFDWGEDTSDDNDKEAQ